MPNLLKFLLPNSVVAGVKDPGWFSPLQPIPTQAPPGTPIRQYGYSPGINLQITPRAEDAISYQYLRMVADGYDILRVAIETAKDQICRLPWRVRTKKVPGETNKARDQRDAKSVDVKTAEALLSRPDGFHYWDAWLRMLLEDCFVLDALTIKADRPSRRLLPIDGATIERYVDYSGLTPLTGSAYAQIVYGTVAGKYGVSDLIYAPRNPRTNRMYGYGPVEQILTTVNIAVSRQEFQLNYYTTGSVPDAICGVPSSWNVDQVKEFQDYWDTIMNLQTRRQMRFIPAMGNGTSGDKLGIVFPKEPLLKDEFDDYLMKIICWSLSISPQQVVKAMNRASAQSSSELAEEEGLLPKMRYLENVINSSLICMGYKDIQFGFESERDIDPLKQAQADEISLKNAIVTINEVRDARGLDPAAEKEADTLGVITLQGFMPIDADAQAARQDKLRPPEPEPTPGGGNSGKPKPNQQKAIEGETLQKFQAPHEWRTVSQETARAAMARERLQNSVQTFLDKAKRQVCEKVVTAFSKLAKDSSTDDKKDAILRATENIDWAPLVPEIARELFEAGVEGAHIGAGQTHISDQNLIVRAQQNAQTYAQKRAAELVGKKLVGNVLVDNPNAKWAVSDTVRDILKREVEQAFSEETTEQDLIDRIQKSAAFGESRSEMVARTEINRSQTGGQVNVWKLTGVVAKVKLVLSADHPCCDECDAIAAKGAMPLEEADLPPIHPRCMCALVVAAIQG